jgi:hypothetical protein
MYSNVVMQVLNLDQPIKMVKFRDLVVTFCYIGMYVFFFIMI